MVVLHTHPRSPKIQSLPTPTTKPTSDNTSTTTNSATSLLPHSPLLLKFLKQIAELEQYKSGVPITLDGSSLSLPAVTAAARYNARVTLTDSPDVKETIASSREVIDRKLKANRSLYGVSTGFGGSADTRTDDHSNLGNALLQHQHAGVLPTSQYLQSHSSNGVVSSDAPFSSPLPLTDPLSTLSMPEPWVRGAMLIRINSLLRGHSGVRWDLMERLCMMLEKDIIPLVPLRGSVSASGDLSPLSYIAGCLAGNPSIYAYVGQRHPGSASQRKLMSAPEALSSASISPLPLLPKEHLGILNGTAFSASLSSLALTSSVQLALLGIACTAMGMEAMLGDRGAFSSFVQEIRPHAGQIEVGKQVMWLLSGSQFVKGTDEMSSKYHGDEKKEEASIEEDAGTLRQDRYPLRTAPQWLGPQLEDLLNSLEVCRVECNSTTDNPLVDPKNGTVYNGGNFQATSIANIMEHTRLNLHHIGKLMFTQLTEIINPSMNRGLPPNLASTDPSINFCCKGIDIGGAAYLSELGYLAGGNVTTHVQSAEMHNQAVNSLALISARKTTESIDVLSILIASYIFALCQALDIRALVSEWQVEADKAVERLVEEHFGKVDDLKVIKEMKKVVMAVIRKEMERTSSMDCVPRMKEIAKCTTSVLFDILSSSSSSNASDLLTNITPFRTSLATALSSAYLTLQIDFLLAQDRDLTKGPRVAPASKYLGKTKALYEFVRRDLGIPMHGRENLLKFREDTTEILTELGITGSQDTELLAKKLGSMTLGASEMTVGGWVSKIHEAIQNDKLTPVLLKMFN